MHKSSHDRMALLLEKYTDARNRQHMTIYDIGSYDVNGSYKDIVERMKFKQYLGMDTRDGPNVDVGLPILEHCDKSTWGKTIPPCDVLISGQCLEHVFDMFKWMTNVASLVNHLGIAIIIAPWRFEEHRFPIDCWRIFPDGMRGLLEYAGFDVLEVGKDDIQPDCWGVGKKY